jgi:ferredoxin-fold anticodon binding domain-containing protein
MSKKVKHRKKIPKITFRIKDYKNENYNIYNSFISIIKNIL